MLVSVLVKISFYLILVASLMVLYRFIAGPTLVDRIIALDVLTLVLIASFVVYTVGLSLNGKGESFYLDVAIIYALLSFIAVVAVAKYLEAKK